MFPPVTVRRCPKYDTPRDQRVSCRPVPPVPGDDPMDIVLDTRGIRRSYQSQSITCRSAKSFGIMWVCIRKKGNPYKNPPGRRTIMKVVQNGGRCSYKSTKPICAEQLLFTSPLPSPLAPAPRERCLEIRVYLPKPSIYLDPAVGTLENRT